MTPYEAADLAQSAFSNALAAYAILITLISGYLVTTYLIGSDLTRLQARLLTVLFLIVASTLIWGMSAWLSWGDIFSDMALPDGTGRSAILIPRWLPIFMAVVNSFTVIGCIIFMWNVRSGNRSSET